MVLHGKKSNIIILIFIACFWFACAASAEKQFDIKRIGNINPYSENAFLIESAENGSLTITIHDSICIYRTIKQRISSGKTKIYWDGCGFNQEMLYKKTYTITAEMETDSGQQYSVSFDSPIEYPDQCLQYAMPSSDKLYLDDLNNWFIEYRTVKDGTINIELILGETGENICLYSINAVGAKIGRKEFSAISGKKTLPKAGIYRIKIYEKTKPDQFYEYNLEIANQKPEQVPVEMTGDIMPERTMSENEIWDIMMKPSVVLDIDFFKHQEVFKEPDKKSQSLGTLHGQTQCVKVIKIENDWAQIGAWNHEDASYIEGWVPYSILKYEYPNKEYGILIDKEKQTLSVYQNGKVADTLLISSGKAEKNKLYQETSAGCFLTGYHRVNFSMNGKKYDYVIQYDGGNLLHQAPYDWGQKKKDFTMGRGYLGAKASHACIRIQPEPGEGGLNAFWIFTHIPYHTRVIILDDQNKREAEKDLLQRGKKEDIHVDSLHTANPSEKSEKQDIVITFGGCLSAQETKSKKNGSFNAYITQNGYESPMKNLIPIFENDDYTIINMNYQKKDKTDNKTSENSILNHDMTELLKISSIDMISMNNDQIHIAETEKSGITSINVPEKCATVILNDHLFGFTGCTEKEYLKEPDIIDKRIGKLKEEKCEKIIFFLSGTEKNTSVHSIVQEAMAHRSIRAGSCLVIGKSNYIQGVDSIEGIPVFYSLGSLLDGNSADKPKNQQGFLLQAVFSFSKGNESVNLTVIPIMPYGNAEKEKNEYSPSINLNKKESEDIIRYIWQDTPNQIMNKISFYIPDQS